MMVKINCDDNNVFPIFKSNPAKIIQYLANNWILPTKRNNSECYYKLKSNFIDGYVKEAYELSKKETYNLINNKDNKISHIVKGFSNEGTNKHKVCIGQSSEYQNLKREARKHNYLDFLNQYNKKYKLQLYATDD